jgi:tripartite-type tricarboxylate transporter receptor subunit TctC
VRARPDGYTLLLAATPNAINATLYDKLNFNFQARHCAGRKHRPLARRHIGHSIVSGKTVPAFIAYAKANPGKINNASQGKLIAEEIEKWARVVKFAGPARTV